MDRRGPQVADGSSIDRFLNSSDDIIKKKIDLVKETLKR